MKKTLTYLLIIIFLSVSIVIQPIVYAEGEVEKEIPTGYQKSEDLEIENSKINIVNEGTDSSSYPQSEGMVSMLSATTTDNIVQSPERDIYMGSQVSVDEDNENLYFVYGDRLSRYSLKDNTLTQIYSLQSEYYSNYNTSSKNGVVYMYKNTKESETGKRFCEIYKYDVISNTELPSVTIEIPEDLGDDTLADLVIDNNGYMYFRYGAANASLISFDKNGNYVDRLENKNQSDYAMSYCVSYNDMAIYYVLPNLPGKSGYVKIDNGKFVDRTFWISDIGQSWRYSEDGTYGIDHIGNVVRFVNDSESNVGVKMEVLLYTGRGLVDYNPAGVFDGDYLYAVGENNTFLKFNLNTRKVEGSYALQSATLEDKFIYDYKVSNGKLYIVLNESNGLDSYYYIVTKDLETDLETVTTIDIDTHEALTHSKQDVMDRAKAAVPVFDYNTSSIYEEEPHYTGAPYVAGSLKEQVEKDTLNQLNFYRWLTGLNEVSLNTQYMDRSQKGAVIQARLRELTHTPAKPADMDDEWYNEAYDGTNAGRDYSGNVAYGTRIDRVPLGFILDTNNISNNVGHRSSMLDPRSDKTSFGYCNYYSAMSMYTTSEDLGNDDVWYSWPAPGYFPVENMDPDMMWSIQLNGDYSFYSGGVGLTLTLTSGDNKKYEVPLDELYYDSYYNNLYFDVPAELLNYLTDGGDSYKPGKTVTVDLCGLIDSEYNNINIHYTTEFIESIEKPAYTLGDINSDGTINTLDAILVLQHISHKNTLTDAQKLAADTSKDGAINTVDAIKILQYVSHKITEF